MKIYKVRFLDITGKEVAEFGFYESEYDAGIRKAEVMRFITMHGHLDVREITVIPDSRKAISSYEGDPEDIPYYELKGTKNERGNL